MEDRTDRLDGEAAKTNRRRVLTVVFFAEWTLFAGLAVWWLLRLDGPGHAGGAPWVVRNGDPSNTSVGERIRDWFRLAHYNFHGIYPWVLMGPYVVWAASRFHFERGRLRYSVPIHLLGCALFASASFALGTRLNAPTHAVIIFSASDCPTDLPWQLLTNKAAASGVSGTEFATNTGAPTAHTSHVRTVTASVVVEADGRMRSLSDLETNLAPGMPDPSLAGGFFTNRASRTVAGSNRSSTPLAGGSGLGEPGAGWPGMAGSGGLALRQYATQSFSHLLDLLAYGSLVGLGQAVHFYRRFRERERQAIRLETHLARARLAALQAQLHPHFLFNALNAISTTLLCRDARAAQEALTSFSELLRLVLSQSNQPEISLREDLEFTARYVEIQRMRLGERLQYDQEVDAEVLDCLVPALLLQPLVENAIRHGVEPSSAPATIRVVARRQGDRLILSVEDTGAGPTPLKPVERGLGIGLANLRARLQVLYGKRQNVEFGPRPEGGTFVRVELPFQRSHRGETSARPAQDAANENAAHSATDGAHSAGSQPRQPPSQE